MSISHLYQLQYACTCPLAQESLYNHTTQLACRVPSPCSHQGTRLKPQLHIPKHIDARCALVLEVQAEELATRHLAMSTPPHTSTHIWDLGREKRDDKLLGSTHTHMKEGKRDGIGILVGKELEEKSTMTAFGRAVGVTRSCVWQLTQLECTLQGMHWLCS